LFFDLNPLTRELPFPLGEPLIVASIQTFVGMSPLDTVWLLKLGPIIPAALSLLLLYSLGARTLAPRWALVASLLAYSFAGWNVLDPHYFLPSGFAWVALFGFMLAYTLPANRRQRLTLASAMLVLAFLFHLYTALLVLFVVVTATSLTIIEGRNRRIAGFLAVLAATAIFAANIAGLSIPIEGAIYETGSLVMMESKVEFALASVTPLVWIALAASLFDRRWEGTALRAWLAIAAVGFGAYLLPIWSSFRILYFPAAMAALVTAGRAQAALQALSRAAIRRRAIRLASGLLISLIFIAATYPSLVPPRTPPITYIAEAGHLVSSNYSNEEFLAAELAHRVFLGRRLLVVSDPGLAHTVGGLIGREAINVPPVETNSRFRALFQDLVEGKLTSPKFVELLEAEASRFFDLGGYDGLLLLVGSRTFYWARTGETPWVPVHAGWIDEGVMEQLDRTDGLTPLHVGDLAFYYWPLATQTAR
jgi:hypothetical protein